MSDLSIQERLGSNHICFGCGPANDQGLRIRSFPDGDDATVADWTPEPHHRAFPGVLAGGIIGTLLDCHGNWTAAWHLMRTRSLDHVPCTVTAEYTIRMRRPTPTDGPVHLRSWVVGVDGDRVEVEGSLTAGGKECATSHGIFVAVQPGHPAYNRW